MEKKQGEEDEKEKKKNLSWKSMFPRLWCWEEQILQSSLDEAADILWS